MKFILYPKGLTEQLSKGFISDITLQGKNHKVQNLKNVKATKYTIHNLTLGAIPL